MKWMGSGHYALGLRLYCCSVFTQGHHLRLTLGVHLLDFPVQGIEILHKKCVDLETLAREAVAIAKGQPLPERAPAAGSDMGPGGGHMDQMGGGQDMGPGGHMGMGGGDMGPGGHMGGMYGGPPGPYGGGPGMGMYR